jgi:polysaccharide biosynthesis/export protein
MRQLNSKFFVARPAVAGLFAAAACVVAMCGCQHRPTHPSNTFSSAVGPALQRVALTNKIEPAWLQPPADRFTLGPGDRLEVELVGETNTVALTTVAPDGKLYYSILPGIDVWGLSLPQVRDRLEEEFSAYLRNRPQIGVHLRAVESKRFWILGRVQEPGVYPLSAPTTLLEAVALSGGALSLSSFASQDVASITDELADLRRSFIIREGRMLPVDFEALIQRGDLSQNIYLQPDDFVYFPASVAREVYVLGAVAQPRPVAYKQGLTVAQAVASAYGTINGAYMHHVAVVRGSLHYPEVVIVDYKQVIRGQAQDIELQPQDIVYVPFSPYRYLHRYLDLIVNTFVSSTAINVGVRAVGTPTTGGAGVFIPVGSNIQIMRPSPPPIR